MKTKSRSFKVLMLILLSFVLLVTVSFAWYYIDIKLKGNTIETVSLTYEAYGYNSDGTLVSTIINEGETSTAANVNSPLYSSASLKPGNSSTVYVSIKSNSTVDLEYNLSIIARGYSSGELHFADLGGYWYRITDITSKVSTLANYISSNKSATESGTLLNMKTMNTSSTFGTIKTTDTSKTKYYRIDFGVNSNATDSQYTENRIELFANIEVDQINNTNNNQGNGQEYKITDSTTLINALENGSSTDTLFFSNDVEYQGDLIIRKALNLNLGGKKLIVTGNVIYNFTSSNSLKINLTGNGSLTVLSDSEVDGNLIFDTPNSQVEITGSGKNSGLIVENDIIVGCANEENKMGCHLSGVSAVKPNGERATIKMKSDSAVAISDITKIDTITAYDDAMNIKVINYGEVDSIVLSNMKESAQTATPQIYIHNYDKISSIVLPSWSKKFTLGTNGTNTGNTRISNSFGAKITNLSGSSNFTKNDILDISSTVFVESVDGTNTNLRVFFKNKSDGTVTTIQGLLKGYFESIGVNVATGIQNITRLEIDSVEGKNFASSDLSFLNGGTVNNTTLSGIKSLDLADANFTSNTLPTKFYTKTTLTELILPKNLTRINSNAFGDTQLTINIKSLTIPESVVSLGQYALRNINVAVFESKTPPKLDSVSKSNYVGSNYNFASEESVDAYDSAFCTLPSNDYTNYPMAVYPYATLSDDGVHFVRPLEDGTYEIVVVDSTAFSNKYTSSSYVIGNGLTVNGVSITVSSIGRCAYLNFIKSSLTVTFTDSVHTVKWRSFDNAYFKNIDFCNVQIFDDYCGRGIDIKGTLKFSNCESIEGLYCFTQSGIGKINTGALKSIGKSAFSACNTSELICPNLINVGETAIYRLPNLVTLETPKVEFIQTNGIAENNKLYEISLPSIKEIGYYGIRANPNLVSLHLGPSLSYLNSAPINACTSLEYLFIETSNYVAIDSLLTKGSSGEESKRITVPRIYVKDSAYNDFYSNISSENKKNLLEYGTVRVGTLNKKLYYQDVNYVDYNVGEYVVRVEKEGVVIVSYNNASVPATVNIPETLVVNGTEMKVIGIGRNVFKSKTTLTTFNAPSITYIGISAFESCTKLTTVNIPNVTHWPANLFKGCSKLAKIVSECKFTSDATAITGTISTLTNITLDYDVESSADLPATTVFEGLKSKCANVVLYVKAKSLSIFKANSIFNALLPASLEQSVTDANGNIYYLTEITINSTTYYQVDYVVGNGTVLVIPTSYNNINVVGAKEGAYDGVTASSITIPRYYTYIKDKEFSNVNGLTSFTIDSNNESFTVRGDVLYTKDLLELVCYPNSKIGESYTIGSSPKVIRASAFENVRNLITVEFSAKFEYIGVDAFKGSSVTTFIFKKGAPPYLLGDNALGSNVTVIDVPDDKIEDYKLAFRNYINYIQ